MFKLNIQFSIYTRSTITCIISLKLLKTNKIKETMSFQTFHFSTKFYILLPTYTCRNKLICAKYEHSYCLCKWSSIFKRFN